MHSVDDLIKGIFSSTVKCVVKCGSELVKYIGTVVATFSHLKQILKYNIFLCIDINPLTCISQKTGLHFVKIHGFYKNTQVREALVLHTYVHHYTYYWFTHCNIWFLWS